MSKTKITAPVAGYTGTGPGGTAFEDGIAHTDDEAAIGYFRSAGYGIDGDVPDRAVEDRVDSRDVPTEVVGTRLRDAAVDPKPSDFLPPTNAGKADPHGPLVVAPGIHGIETQVIRPGVVHVDDLDAQEKAETDQAIALLVENKPVSEALASFVPDESDTGPLGLSDPGSAAVGVAEAKKAADDSPVEDESPRPAAKKAAAKRKTPAPASS